MSGDLRGFEYDVALSFAGEDRGQAEAVASALQDKGVRVFYDRWEEADLWGKDLYQHLSDVYKKAARFCVVFVSKDYAAKSWTNHELRSAQARAFRENAEYILPVRLDDTELPGVLETTGYIDFRRVSPAQLANLLFTKLAKSGGPASPGPSTTPSGPGFRVPRIPAVGTDPNEDAHALVTHVERVLDSRISVLRDAGLTVQKGQGANGLRSYRIAKGNRLLYFLKMKVGSILGPNVISFLDGWSDQTNDDASTAFVEVIRSLGDMGPKARVTNLSLLDAPSVSVVLSFDELADGIWSKACNVIEGFLNNL